MIVSLILVVGPSLGFGADESGSGAAADPAPTGAQELYSLVALIALYPDPLVAEVLSASTFPDQVAIADYWLQENKSLSGQALMQAVDKVSWNVSVKALTQFPSVLHNMAQNLNWTSTWGAAYHNQPAQIMSAIQTLREQARAAGNLKSGPQITDLDEHTGDLAANFTEYNPADGWSPATPHATSATRTQQ